MCVSPLKINEILKNEKAEPIFIFLPYLVFIVSHAEPFQGKGSIQTNKINK